MRPNARSCGAFGKGTTFAEICELIADGIEGDPAVAINQRLARWLRDGLLLRE